MPNDEFLLVLLLLLVLDSATTAMKSLNHRLEAIAAQAILQSHPEFMVFYCMGQLCVTRNGNSLGTSLISDVHSKQMERAEADLKLNP